ncbi:hypothetical protein AWB69_00532 [Caballeronia udeis]|uniref:Uncharacterized protein n=1 Tax=Caballeronia udeis TaxID=1232866 RepID=A0A158F274_9BURK|nr:hypothetical protein AWB69_00532 [Caballeronia udeis]
MGFFGSLALAKEKTRIGNDAGFFVRLILWA